MGFALLDYVIVTVYLLGVTLAGVLISGRQRTARDYFLGGKQMSWWSVGFSIVASETSTLTFISIPGLAFKGNLFFLQLVVGYFIGRLIVSVVFIPAYYRGDLETAYDFLGKRFGLPLRKFTSTVFIVTRVLASGVRLFATAIPVHLITGLGYPASILLIGGFTLLYTYLGGLKAVVAMDVVQLFIYLGGAVASMVLILHHLPNGWSDVVAFATSNGQDKFAFINGYTGTSLLAFLMAPVHAAWRTAGWDIPDHGIPRNRPATCAAASGLPDTLGQPARPDARCNVHSAAVRVLPRARIVPVRLLWRCLLPAARTGHL